MDQQTLIPHLFRTEFSKITTVLSKLFGLAHIEIAEDIASETFLSAMETWPYKGIPDNPTGWLYAVAKNKAINYINRNKNFVEKINQQARKLENFYVTEIDLSTQNITDSQLQMLFAICHPSISPEGQVGLALRILCGFGIDEIATAFLQDKDTINKRLYRAKEKLRQEKIELVFPGESEIDSRLDTVLTTLYLMFSEGYYSENQDSPLREDLCVEAMRLTHLLIENEHTNLPNVNAIFSLMCFHASRFPARKSEPGEFVLYADQDENLWNKELISQGAYRLKEASQGNKLSKYHLEASIAFWHTQKTDTKEKWENILQLYNKLLALEYSPVAALNRTFALSKARTNEEAIAEAEKLQLTSNHYYYTLLGALYENVDREKSLAHYKVALSLAKSNTDRNTIRKKIDTSKAE